MDLSLLIAAFCKKISLGIKLFVSCRSSKNVIKMELIFIGLSRNIFFPPRISKLISSILATDLLRGQKCGNQMLVLTINHKQTNTIKESYFLFFGRRCDILSTCSVDICWPDHQVLIDLSTRLTLYLISSRHRDNERLDPSRAP